MEEPKIAAKNSIPVDVEEGKKYFFCSCGSSQNQPFCDGAHSGTDFSPIAFVAERPERLISANARGAIKFLTATGPTIHSNVISIFALMPN